MARTSILGKRKASDSPTAPSVETRKRRVLRSTSNDENADPECLPDAAETSKLRCLDESKDAIVVSSKLSKNPTRPVKHTTDGVRIALSPAKVNGRCISTATVPRESSENPQLATPKTPRHRDALQNRITVAVTPRHRTIATPRTPRSTPSAIPTVYACARRLFVRSANSGPLVGRDEERVELNDFINGGIESKSGRCLYVSGPPGTGKSALVSEVFQALGELGNLRSAHINCMSIKSSQDIYAKLVVDLCGDGETLRSDAMTTLKGLFFPKKKSSSQVYAVTLDEIDHLLTLDLEILYTLFEWALNPSSRLILIGIANALDLTDRFLPRLKARNLKPKLLPFLPYTVSQITSVITTKLKSLLPLNTTSPDYLPIIHPTAIQFCSKKVASQTGDLRKVFDIVRRSIDLIEIQTKQKCQKEIDARSFEDSPSKTHLVENNNLASPTPSPCLVTKGCLTLSESLSRLTPETAPRATIAHMARVTSLAFNNGTAQRLQSLNLQQKAALCGLLAMEKKTARLKRDLFATPSKSANAAPTIRKAYEMYCALCRRDNALHPLTSTEFADVIGSLETLSLVHGGDGKGMMGLGVARLTPKKMIRPEDRTIASCVSEKEVEASLEGAGGAILRGLLREG